MSPAQACTLQIGCIMHFDTAQVISGGLNKTQRMTSSKNQYPYFCKAGALCGSEQGVTTVTDLLHFACMHLQQNLCNMDIGSFTEVCHCVLVDEVFTDCFRSAIPNHCHLCHTMPFLMECSM